MRNGNGHVGPLYTCISYLTVYGFGITLTLRKYYKDVTFLDLVRNLPHNIGITVAGNRI